jgi:hypothetical protein
MLGSVVKTSDGEISHFRFRGVNEAMRAGGAETLGVSPAALLVVGVSASLLTVGVIHSFLKFKRSGVVDTVGATWWEVGAIGFGSSARGRITDGSDWRKGHTLYIRKSQILGGRRLGGMLKRGDKGMAAWGASLLLWD